MMVKSQTSPQKKTYNSGYMFFSIDYFNVKIIINQLFYINEFCNSKVGDVSYPLE